MTPANCSTRLRQVRPANDQGEYYLTDVAAILKSAGESVGLYLHPDSREVSGINTRAELAEFENLLRRSTIRRLMLEAGVTFIDPSHTYISAEATIGRDCVIHPDVSHRRQTVIGEGLRDSSGLAHHQLASWATRVTVKIIRVIVDSEIGR